MYEKINKEKIQNSTCWKPNTNWINIKSDSWFSIHKIEEKQAEKVNQCINTSNIRNKQIVIHPNKEQRKILLEWFEIYRLIYNATIKYLRINKEKISKYDLRTSVKNDLSTHLKDRIKKSGIYAHTVNEAIIDVYKAKKSAFSNLRNKNIKYFRMRYKKQKHRLKILTIDPVNFNKQKTGIGRGILRDLNPSSLIDTKKYSRMQYNSRNNKFLLFTPYNKIVKENVDRNSYCSLDPGVRNFQTIYSPSGVVYKIFDDKKLIDKNNERIEKVKKYKDKSWYRKYVDRIRQKTKNRVDDLHWKTSKLICKNFNNILIGNMSTKGIVKNGKSVLSDKIKRTLYAQSHFLFKQRLESKAKEYNVSYKLVDESYTSKTCGSCATINENLGGSIIFKCSQPECQYLLDRDIHGARNIYIKNT